jgi:hypothetical protein
LSAGQLARSAMVLGQHERGWRAVPDLALT